jgi:hypothetical protein
MVKTHPATRPPVDAPHVCEDAPDGREGIEAGQAGSACALMPDTSAAAAEPLSAIGGARSRADVAQATSTFLRCASWSQRIGASNPGKLRNMRLRREPLFGCLSAPGREHGYA